jgi:hypothetical protein
MFVCLECCVLSGRDLCDELITRSEDSYRPWPIFVCDLETSWIRRPWPTGGCHSKYKLLWNDIFVGVIVSTNIILSLCMIFTQLRYRFDRI